MMAASLTQEDIGQANPDKGKTKTIVALVLAGALATGLLGTVALSALAQAGTSTHAVMTAEFMHAQDNAG